MYNVHFFSHKTHCVFNIVLSREDTEMSQTASAPRNLLSSSAGYKSEGRTEYGEDTEEERDESSSQRRSLSTKFPREDNSGPAS